MKKWIPIAAVTLCLSNMTSAFALTLGAHATVLDAYAAESQGKVDQAISQLMPLYQSEPNDYFLNMRLGWLFSQSKKFKNSLDHYDRAAKINSTSLEPLLGRGQALIAAGDFAHAAQAYQEVLKREPQNYMGRQRLIQSYLRLNQFSDALKETEIALKSYPIDATFLEQRGFALKQSGDSAEAKKTLALLLLVNPKNAYAQSVLGASQ